MVFSADAKTKEAELVNFDGMSDLTVIALYQFSERNSIATSFEVDDFLLASEQLVVKDQKAILALGYEISGFEPSNFPDTHAIIRLTTA